MKKKKKLTVKTGQFIFSGEIYYYLIQVRKLTKLLVKHHLICIIYCVTNTIAVMYSKNIPIAEKQIVCFQGKKRENM